MREGLETSPAPGGGRSARPAVVAATAPESPPCRPSDASRSATPHPPCGSEPKRRRPGYADWGTAPSIKVRYTRGSGAGKGSANEAGPGGAEGAIGAVLGVLGCVMILVGALRHRLAETCGTGMRRYGVDNGVSRGLHGGRFAGGLT